MVQTLNPERLASHRGFDIEVTVDQTPSGLYRPRYRLRLGNEDHLPVGREASDALFDTAADACAAALSDARDNIDAMLDGGV